MVLKTTHYFSFCGRHEREVARLITAPGFVAICNVCIENMHKMLGESAGRDSLLINSGKGGERKS
jgi:ATP-dependent protease Clp ATPase subunit